MRERLAILCLYMSMQISVRPGRLATDMFTCSQASFVADITSSHIAPVTGRRCRRYRKVSPNPPFRTGETAISSTLYTGGIHLSILMGSGCLRRSSICEVHYLLMRYAVQITASLTNLESQVDETESAAKIVCHLPAWAFFGCRDSEC